MSPDLKTERDVRVVCYISQNDLLVSSFSVQVLVRQVLSFKKTFCTEVICHLVDRQTICTLHKDFFDDSHPTDCISFPIDPPSPFPTKDCLLGEIFICPQVAIEYAQKHRLDPYKELSLYLVHGLLHLLGYEDLTREDRTVMRQEEKDCLCYLEENNGLLSA